MPTIAPIAIEAGQPTGLPGSWGCPGFDGRAEEKTMLKRVCWTALAAASLASGIAAAQSFPSRTIHLVSGVTPGSASDTTARIVAEKLQASLGQAVIVENKLGVGGLIGAAYVAKADPDGHVISIYTSAFTVAPQVKEGKLRALAVGSPKRSALFPEVRTTVEAG